ncbi:MAG: AtpZ/AtpI family protein [Pseudomonadota bacterium]
MGERSERDRLAELEARIRRAQKGPDSESAGNSEGEVHTQSQLAWRMVTELVAGLLIGFGIGYGLDQLIGTTPWLMIVFTVLGLVAGVRVMVRSADEVARRMAERDAPGIAEDEGEQRGERPEHKS